MSFQVEVFYDGDCPLCLKEIQFLRWADKRRNRIRFTDIAAPAFDARSTGRTMDELMDRIHGRLPTGQLIEGVEVFRQLYSAIGLGWIVAFTRLSGLRWLLDVAYRFFARNRLKWTGRCTPEAGCVIDRDSRESSVESPPTQTSAAPLEHVR